jgi:hypothetical protein
MIFHRISPHIEGSQIIWVLGVAMFLGSLGYAANIFLLSRSTAAQPAGDMAYSPTTRQLGRAVSEFRQDPAKNMYSYETKDMPPPLAGH